MYILNDIVDLEADRAHAHKKFRPLASGRLPLSIGFLLAPVLLVLGLVGSLALSVQFAAVTLTYFSFSLLYTFVLKKLVLYDVFALAILFIHGASVCRSGSVRHPAVYVAGVVLLLFIHKAWRSANGSRDCD